MPGANEPAFDVVTTATGARAVRCRETGEAMHPVVGPIVEAENLYVKPSRLGERLQNARDFDANDPLVLLDVGLGAGSNAIAAWKVSEALPAPARRLSIVSFDRTGEAMALATSDAYARSFGFDETAKIAAARMLDERIMETARTSWRFVLGDLPATLRDERSSFADILFWDPFSPRKNPTLWNMHAFTEARRLCRDRATLHTYSAATATRSAMLLAGFYVGLGPGTHDGKETTEASIDPRDLARPLDQRWFERLARSSAAFPADAGADALARVAAHPQFGRV